MRPPFAIKRRSFDEPCIKPDVGCDFGDLPELHLVLVVLWNFVEALLLVELVQGGRGQGVWDG
jgi:hypothetical protein